MAAELSRHKSVSGQVFFHLFLGLPTYIILTGLYSKMHFGYICVSIQFITMLREIMVTDKVLQALIAGDINDST
jgi:hypothetical protein